MRLEPIPVELADQVRQRLRRAAELAAVMDEQDRKRALALHRLMLASALARIGFDGLMISPHGKGHARSQRHAVEALAARGEHEIVVFVREPGAAGLLAGLQIEVVPVGDRLTIAWELRGMPRAARRHRLDAFLTLSERIPLAGGPPTVVWLFESPVHRIRQNRAQGALLRHRASDTLTSALWRRSLSRAAHVAFGSHATEAEVLAAVPALRGCTSVAYPGVAPGFSPGSGPDRPAYALHLGSDDPRDNTRVAIEAAQRAGVRLVVAGSASPHAGAEFAGRVSDEELMRLYRGASVFVEPTLYEGFGYGVLEAMACGAPVVASAVTSIPEVVGDAALLCPVGDVGAFARAVRRVLDEDELAATLRERGLARAATFTWERTCADLSAAIAAALG
jgi:glycosyltransferase involved in cell wall biosynthesis